MEYLILPDDNPVEYSSSCIIVTPGDCPPPAFCTNCPLLAINCNIGKAGYIPTSTPPIEE